MKRLLCTLVATCILCPIAEITAESKSSQFTPLPTKILNIDSWQKGLRGEGLANLQRILPNLMAVNAQDEFPLNYQAADYE